MADSAGRSKLPGPFLRREARLIIAFLIVVVALFAVIRLGSEIREDGTSGFDRSLLLALRQPGDLARPIGPGWLRQMFLDITALGGVTVLTMITIVAVGYLVVARKYRSAALVAAAIISGSLVSDGLKNLIVRPRPTIVPHLVEVHSLSYPSGHATNSMVVFLTLGVLLARAQAERRMRIYVVAVAMLCTILIGFSRAYVGVHWPTDVLAGWAVGGSWALLWWSIAMRLQRGRDVISQRGGMPERET